MKDCFNSNKDKYKKTHTQLIATGFGLTADNLKNTGIETIKKNIDSMCPHYQEVNNLMVKKSFVKPLYKVYAQKDVETTNSSNSKDEDSDSSDSSNNSENGRYKKSEDLSIHARTIRERESFQSVR